MKKLLIIALLFVGCSLVVGCSEEEEYTSCGFFYCSYTDGINHCGAYCYNNTFPSEIECEAERERLVDSECVNLEYTLSCGYYIHEFDESKSCEEYCEGYDSYYSESETEYDGCSIDDAFYHY